MEIQLVNRMRRILEQNGAITQKTHGTGNATGWPDIMATMPIRVNKNGAILGVTIAIEVKRPKHKPTPIQMDRLARIERAGGIAFWSCNPDEIMNIIKAELQARMKGNLTILQNHRPMMVDNKYKKQDDESVVAPPATVDDIQIPETNPMEGVLANAG